MTRVISQCTAFPFYSCFPSVSLMYDAIVLTKSRIGVYE